MRLKMRGVTWSHRTRMDGRYPTALVDLIMPQLRLELKFFTLLAAAKEEPILIIVTWDKFGVVFSVHFSLVMTAAAQLLRPIDCRLGPPLVVNFLVVLYPYQVEYHPRRTTSWMSCIISPVSGIRRGGDGARADAERRRDYTPGN